MTCLYFIASGSFVKIGYSSDIKSRLADLQRFNPEPLEVLGVVPLATPRALQLERLLHRHFAPYRHRFEWFHECDAILDYIEEHATPYARNPDEACSDCRFSHSSEAIRECEASCPLAGLRPSAHPQNDQSGLTEGVSRWTRVADSDR